MRSVIALGFAAVLFGTAFAQDAGAGQKANLLTQMDQANHIVAHVDHVYGTHFVIVQAAPQDAIPHMSWDFGPRTNLYPNGQ